MAELFRLPMWSIVAVCAFTSVVGTLIERLANGQRVKLEELIGATLWTGIGTVSIGTLLAPFLASDWSLLMIVSTLTGPGAATLAEWLFLDLRKGISFILLLWSSRREDR